jgi:hypothetical protein
MSSTRPCGSCLITTPAGTSSRRPHNSCVAPLTNNNITTPAAAFTAAVAVAVAFAFAFSARTAHELNSSVRELSYNSTRRYIVAAASQLELPR